MRSDSAEQPPEAWGEEGLEREGCTWTALQVRIFDPYALQGFLKGSPVRPSVLSYLNKVPI